MKTYAAIAQVIYRDGMWSTSEGLVSHQFKAKGFKSAQLKAHSFYMAKWRHKKRRLSKTVKLTKLHVSVVEL
jgi:hypothetical protein